MNLIQNEIFFYELNDQLNLEFNKKIDLLNEEVVLELLYIGLKKRIEIVTNQG